MIYASNGTYKICILLRTSYDVMAVNCITSWATITHYWRRQHNWNNFASENFLSHLCNLPYKFRKSTPVIKKQQRNKLHVFYFSTSLCFRLSHTSLYFSAALTFLLNEKNTYHRALWHWDVINKNWDVINKNWDVINFRWINFYSQIDISST